VDLSGNTTVFGPISVLQLINLAQTTGELVLHVSPTTARIYFDKGSVTYAEITNRRVKLGEYLVQQGLISRETLDQALAAKKDKTRLGTVLVAMGAVDTLTLRRALEEQVKEVVYEVVRWRSGSFRFTAGRKPKNQEVSIDIPLDHLILEGLKRLDEEKVRR
jgi:hypothetical protein